MNFALLRYLLLSLGSGILLSLAWPTYGVPFFIFVALVPLLMIEHSIRHFTKFTAKGWRIFGLSYLAFFIWNCVTTGWLYEARNPDGSHSLVAAAFPVAVNSLLYAAVFSLYSWYKNKQGTYWGLAFFVAIWMSFEKFHLEWELSWPWLNLGNAFSEYPKLIQWYDTFGATGGTLWILLINLFIFYTIRTWEASRKKAPLLKNIAGVMALILLPMLISYIKYQNFDEKSIGTVNTLMLQPELDPYGEKYTKDSLTILKELLTLAEKNSSGKIDYYIAPETALPGYGSISEAGFPQSRLLNDLSAFVASRPGSVFASGISSHQIFQEEGPVGSYEIQPGTFVQSFNSAVQIIPGKKVEVYHKAKLVPGVEIFPYISVLKPVLGNAMLNLGGTVASLGRDEERKVFSNNFNPGKMAPIICYESIYGEFVTDYVKKGANFLGIMTNDSWWGNTQGYKQLLSYARLRAIENRREIARAANSGVSAHINALGEIEEDTIYGDRTALFAKIKLYDSRTFYSRSGDLLSRVCEFALGFLLLYMLAERFQPKGAKR